MKRSFLIRSWVVIGILALARNASGATPVDEQVKGLAQQYKEVEDQLPRSVHYLRKTESDGATTTEQAWFNGGDDLIKVAVERTDSSGRGLTEYFTRDIELSAEPMFVLTRKETPLPDGGMQVDESRKYFGENQHGNGQLIRELRKSARFKPGESTDTVHVPNVVVDLRKQPKDNRSDEERIRAESEFFDQPQKIATGLKEAGPPDSNPFANVKGDSDKFRVIRGTASPDGRFAIALGFAREKINWDDFLEKESGEEGKTYSAEDEEEEDIRNYVVDLAQQKIFGETGCNYFGTRRRYNHRECVVTWSPDSLNFVQLWDDKWASRACVAGKINPGPKFAGAADLDKAIEKKTYAFVKERFYPEMENGGNLSLHIKRVGDDGVIELDALEINSGVQHRGDTIFAVNERLHLSDGPKGPRLEILKMRRLPND
jgi:hypothetical protein